MGPFGKSGEVDTAGNQPDMTERLRVISQEGSAARIDLLGEQPEGIRPRAQGVEECARLVELALLSQVIHQPETAQQEGALMSWQTVGGLVGEIAVEQAVAGPQALADGGCGGDHVRMVGGNHASQGQGQKAGIESTTTEVLGEGSHLRVPGFCEDRLTDALCLHPPPFNVAAQAETLG